MAGILFVCTANLCRSPMAEVFARALLSARFGPGPELVPIASAGTIAEAGYPLWPLAREELARRGLEPAGFRSRRLDPDDVLTSDLVLTATRAVRDEVRAHVPGAYDRIFTFRELALLVSGVTGSRIRELTPAARLRVLPRFAAERRGEVTPPTPGELDVVDPVGHGDEHFRDVADEIQQAIIPLVDML